MSDRFDVAGEKFGELLRLMARLRGPGGCPWDQKQTFDTIKKYLLEETYEVMDAIDQKDWAGLEEELGDLLLQPVFFAAMAEELAEDGGRFSISDSLDRINEKLIRRHPHIFGSGHAETAEDVKRRWDEIKLEEKASQGKPRPGSLLDRVPRTLPALMECEKIGHSAAAEGFDWPEVTGALEKLQEEAGELTDAQLSGDQDHIEHELGDLLFSVVNVSRHIRVDPEQALKKANARFRRRFAGVEETVANSGSSMKDTPLTVLEEYWQAAKRSEGVK